MCKIILCSTRFSDSTVGKKTAPLQNASALGNVSSNKIFQRNLRVYCSTFVGSLEAVAQEIAAARKSAVELSALPDKPESGETMELDNFAAVREKELLAEVELKRKIRMTPVSTDDQEVLL